MNIINIEIQEWTTVLFKFNWLAIVIILALIWILSFLMKKCLNHINKKCITVDEMSLGMG